MEFQGVLKKMETEFANPIQYYLMFNSDFVHVNQLLNKTISIAFVKFQCLNCGSNVPIFRQGFCKRCFFDIPQAADWIIHPELSKAHLNIEDRDLEYEKKVQLQPHIVYLANSSSVKVGVTRKTQVPTRWIDQGAHAAIEIVEVPNRYLAGITETALKNYVSDKTNWRSMVTNQLNKDSLLSWREQLLPHIPNEVIPYIINHPNETLIEFPVTQYPVRPLALNLEKTAQYTGVLKGIKGQYLLFEDQTIFNVRSNEGLVIKLGLA